MSRRSLFLSLLGAACSCGLLGPAHASETLRLDGLRPLDTPISLVERYTKTHEYWHTWGRQRLEKYL